MLEVFPQSSPVYIQVEFTSNRIHEPTNQPRRAGAGPSGRVPQSPYGYVYFAGGTHGTVLELDRPSYNINIVQSPFAGPDKRFRFRLVRRRSP